MPFTQLKYENGGGGGGAVSVPAVPAGSAAIPPATAIPASLHGPWNWTAWPQYPNQQHLITDLDILDMSPTDAVGLYYALNQYEKARTGGLAYEWEAKPLPGVSDGLTSVEAEGYEIGLRNRMYLLRADLHTIELPDGSTVEGLVDLSKTRTIPEMGLTTGGQVFKYIIVAASSILTAGAGLAITLGQLAVNLAMTAAKTLAAIRAAQAKLDLVDRVIAGAYAIVGKQFRDQLLHLGINLLDYEEAVKIKTSALAWQIALSIGLPHPAMICTPQPPFCAPKDESLICTYPFWSEPQPGHDPLGVLKPDNNTPCSPYYQAWFLLRLLDRIKDTFALNVRRGVENAVRFNGKWHLKNRLEIWSYAGVSRLAIVPEIFTVNGRVMLQDWTTGQYIDPTEHAELAPIVTWLQVRDNPAVTSPVPSIYGANSPLLRPGELVTGPVPPASVLADMSRAAPLAPPAVFAGSAPVPFSTAPAPVTVVTGATAETIPFAPGTGLTPLAPPAGPSSSTSSTSPTTSPDLASSIPAIRTASSEPTLAAAGGNSLLVLGAVVGAAILFARPKRKRYRRRP